MAGAYTHWMIIEEAIENLPNGDFAIALGQKKNFVAIGAVGPDYPYMSELKGNLFKIHSWANRMHYENTLDFIKCGLFDLLAMNKEEEEFRICLAWLCGYISHLLADAIIHPVVNSIVGGTYLFNSHDHRICEMLQDSKIFFDRKEVDLSNAEYVKLLVSCSDPKKKNSIHPVINNFWSKILKKAHPNAEDHFVEIDPDEWHKAYLSAFKKVSNPIPVFRHIGEELDLVYKKSNELPEDEKKKYYTAIKLPKRKTLGEFKKDVFDTTVKRVIEVWQELFSDIDQGDTAHCSNYLGNWNLDTGLNEDNLIFWG